MLTLSQILFALLCFAVAWIAKKRAERPIDSAAEYLVVSLSLLAGGIAALGELILDPAGSDSGTLQRMLTNLAVYTGAPMLVTALLALARDYPISRPAWGRWLLGLIALFEFCRRMSYGEQYTLVLALSLIAALIISLIWFKIVAVRSLMALTTLLFGASVGAYYEFSLASALLLCSGSILLLGIALLRLPANNRATED